MSSVIYNNWDPCEDGGNAVVPDGPPCRDGMAYEIDSEQCYAVPKNSADEAWYIGNRNLIIDGPALLLLNGRCGLNLKPNINDSFGRIQFADDVCEKSNWEGFSVYGDVRRDTGMFEGLAALIKNSSAGGDLSRLAQGKKFWTGFYYETAAEAFENDGDDVYADLDATNGNPLLRLQGSTCAAEYIDDCCLALEFDQQQE